MQDVISAVAQVQVALKPLMQTLNTSPCSPHTRGGAHWQDVISAATKAQALQFGRCAWPDDAAAAHAPVTCTVQECGHGMSAICHVCRGRRWRLAGPPGAWTWALSQRRWSWRGPRAPRSCGATSATFCGLPRRFDPCVRVYGCFTCAVSTSKPCCYGMRHGCG